MDKSSDKFYESKIRIERAISSGGRIYYNFVEERLMELLNGKYGEDYRIE
jgi:hypothetical protein